MNWEALGAIGEIVGAVAVVLTLGCAPEGDRAVRFWVHDNGVPLTHDQLSRLFVPFSRLLQSLLASLALRTAPQPA